MNAVDNEAQLTREASNGSSVAFEALVRTYEPRIRRMIYGLTQDVQLTQDLCQETFLAAYRALPRMNTEELRFAPWLYRIALNQVRSEWRKRKHVTVLSFSSALGADDESGFDEAAENYLLTEQAFEDTIVRRDLVERALAELPPSSASCLLLDAEGFSYKEIAETLQESLSAVRSRLSRARRAFQRIYAQLDTEGHE